MEKKDLKAGMMVELRNGSRYVLIPNSYGLQLINVKNATNWESSLSGFNDDLTSSDKFIKNIVKVYGLSYTSPFNLDDRKLLWERDFKIKLTTEEIEILKALKVLGMKAIARDKDRRLNAFDTLCLGSTDDGYWLKSFVNTIGIKSSTFNFIKCEKAESIDELLKGVK